MKIYNPFLTSIVLLIFVGVESGRVSAMEADDVDNTGMPKLVDDTSKKQGHTWEEKGKEKEEEPEATSATVYAALQDTTQEQTPILRYPAFNLRRSIPETPLYQGNYTSDIRFRPLKEAEGGSSIATIYYLLSKQNQWIGKIGEENDFIEDDPSSYRTRKLKSLNLDAIREKIAADFYSTLSQGRFHTPQTCLSLQEVSDRFMMDRAYTRIEKGIKTTLRIMSRFVEGYHDFSDATTKLNKQKVSFMEFLKQCRRPPDRIHTPQGKLVPLLGIMEILAAMRVLADTDGLGGSGKNAGFVYETNDTGSIVAARAVKIDPGFAFQFIVPRAGGYNSILNTKERMGNSQWWVGDLRDIQVANNNMSITILWQNLTTRQRQQFLDALDTMIHALTQSEKDLMYCFYRNNTFYRNEHEQVNESVAELLMSRMKKWLLLQKEIYHQEIKVRQASFHYPPPLDHFVGREDLLVSMAQRLTPSRDKVSVAVLCGLAGMGKSELAKYFAFRERGSYDLIYWLQADIDSNLIASYLGLAEVLKLSLKDRTTLDAIRDEVYVALEQRKYPWLLIFDNAEENIALPKRGGSVIITSRRRDLWDTQAVVDLSSLTQEEIVDFLQKETDEVDLESMKALAQRCGGIPLALSSVTGFIRQGGITIAEYLKQVKKESKASQKSPLAVVLELMFDQAKKQNPKAFEMLLLCAFLHPENIPVTWIEDLLEHEHHVPQAEVDDRAREMIAFLKGYNLIRFDGQRQVFSLHRLLHKALQEYSGDQAERHVARVLFLLERQGDKFDSDKVETWQDAQLWAVHAESLLEEQKSELKASAACASMLSVLGRLYKQLGNSVKPLKYHYHALEMYKKIHGEGAHPDVAASLNNIGLALNSQGKYDDALDYCHQALEMKKKVYGEGAHPDVADSLISIGNALKSQGKYDDALDYCHQALEMYKKVYGEGAHPNVANSLNSIGNALYSQGKYEDALGYYRQALEMKKKVYGEGAHPDVAMSLNNIGIVLKAQGKYDDALDYYHQALEMKKKVYGEGAHPAVADSLNNIGVVLKAQGKYDDALDYYHQALEMKKKVYGEGAHPYVADSLNNIGLVLYSQGKSNEAAKYYEQALEMKRKLYKNSPNPALEESIRITERNLAAAKRRCFLQ